VNDLRRLGYTAEVVEGLVGPVRRLGYNVEVVERLAGPELCRRLRKDLIGTIDVVAVKAGAPVLGVQATTEDDFFDRLAMVGKLPELRSWLASGARFQVWMLPKRGGRGTVVKLEMRLQGDDLKAVPVEPEGGVRCPGEP
jgi:hypothetical protein